MRAWVCPTSGRLHGARERSAGDGGGIKPARGRFPAAGNPAQHSDAEKRTWPSRPATVATRPRSPIGWPLARAPAPDRRPPPLRPVGRPHTTRPTVTPETPWTGGSCRMAGKWGVAGFLASPHQATEERGGRDGLQRVTPRDRGVATPPPLSVPVKCDTVPLQGRRAADPKGVY